MSKQTAFHFCCGLVTVVMGTFMASSVLAQPPAAPPPAATKTPQPPATKTPAPAVKAKPPVKKGVEDPKLTPRFVSMRTKDGVELNVFYAPSDKIKSDKGKEAIPVLIIHEWQGQASQYSGLVKTLHEAGYAVIVPDYRGHGRSRTKTDPTGNTKEFNIATMGKADVANIILYDLEEVKQFLKKENNEGNLNLNALTLVGVREGAIIAANWAIRDWNFPSVGRIKQGQDVKGVVMVSPVKNAHGLAIDTSIRDQTLLQLPIMIVAGEESEDASEATRVGKQVETAKKRMTRGEAKGFGLMLVPTSLSGPALVAQGPGVMPSIASFITANVKISETLNPWVERE